MHKYTYAAHCYINNAYGFIWSTAVTLYKIYLIVIHCSDIPIACLLQPASNHSCAWKAVLPYVLTGPVNSIDPVTRNIMHDDQFPTLPQQLPHLCDIVLLMSTHMREKIQNGGTVMAAFLPEGQLAGFCCVGGDLAGETASYANLLLLFVDDRFKRHGIGRLLLQEACGYAKKLGAEKLFLSAIPSEDTIAFYQKEDQAGQ